MQTKVKTPTEITAMRESGRMLATVLQVLKASLQPGMSTKDLANIAARELEALGGNRAGTATYEKATLPSSHVPR